MPGPQTLLTGLAFGESPRWHEDRLWVSNLAHAGSTRTGPARCSSPKRPPRVSAGRDPRSRQTSSSAIYVAPPRHEGRGRRPAATSNAASASSHVESSTGSGDESAPMSRGISVHASATASQPRSRSLPMMAA
jgi:hypothetical protein